MSPTSPRARSRRTIARHGALRSPSRWGQIVRFLAVAVVVSKKREVAIADEVAAEVAGPLNDIAIDIADRLGAIDTKTLVIGATEDRLLGGRPGRRAKLRREQPASEC